MEILFNRNKGPNSKLNRISHYANKSIGIKQLNQAQLQEWRRNYFYGSIF